MDLKIGQHCGVSLCHQLDFLPFKCKFCNMILCKDHRLPQYHGCTGDFDKFLKEKPDSVTYSYACQHGGCNGGELTPVICSGCKKNFCLAHRHQVDHKCTAYNEPTNPLAEAAQKMETITSKMSTSVSSKGQGRKNDKLAAKVQLMKLKQKSDGTSGLPQEERLYFLVMLPTVLQNKAKTHSVYVSHYWTVGRAVDAIADLAKVPNRNNVVDADKLTLFRVSDGSSLGAMDVQLKTLVDDQQLYNGQSLILEYVPKGTELLEGYKNYKL
ncbi:unnamed protein product, partial [Meganyctiphanes norvegica]